MHWTLHLGKIRYRCRAVIKNARVMSLPTTMIAWTNFAALQTSQRRITPADYMDLGLSH